MSYCTLYLVQHYTTSASLHRNHCWVSLRYIGLDKSSSLSPATNLRC